MESKAGNEQRQEERREEKKEKKFVFKKRLEGHGGWVTCLAPNPNDPQILLSGSRDKKIMQWQISKEDDSNLALPETQRSHAVKSYKGHGHFVSDLCLSSDGCYALSSSWDHTLRLWDLQKGVTTTRFVGHTKDVLSVSLSADNRQIISGSRDRSIKMWNTLGKDVVTIQDNGHSDWVSCVRFSPTGRAPVIVSAGWDHLVKVWNKNTCELMYNCYGHTSAVNAVAISPDGSLCATGGRDSYAMLWEFSSGSHLKSLNSFNTDINCLAFSPTEYLLVAGTSRDVIIWDLQEKKIYSRLKLGEQHTEGRKIPVSCHSIAFSCDGSYLFAGCSDNTVCVWNINPAPRRVDAE